MIPQRLASLLLVALCIPSSTLGFVLPHQQAASISNVRLNSNHDDESSSSSSPSAINRRSALSQGGVALSSLLLSPILMNQQPAYAADFNDGKKKRILITGSSSGIGMDAAQRMVLRGHEIVLACRTMDKANAAMDKIETNIANDSDDAVEANTLLKSLKLTPMACDLADLSSIDAFVKNLDGQQPFDAVCYNAGLARNTGASDVARTKEGFELTVGTNHLGHFYLHQKLLPLINKDSGRIVVTASGVHDPDSPGGAQGELATLGDLQGFENAVANGSKQFDMVDGGEFNADKAYKDSKLCNVLFTREMQRRLNESGSGIKVNCFNPGLIVGTGLFRDQNQVFTKLFDVAATKLLKVGESTHWGGGAIEWMALGEKMGEDGGLYCSSAPGSSKYGDDAYGKQFGVSEVSKEALASDNGKAKRFWELSEKLVGM
eukprot:CAMPEP_0201885240 /NCGR_PEP_ID=MMETSP0902-20130614/18374_1 /ASSEMBLY_ACC=CAM_ASM_000551 /TAXON_ID=420261 /ORGANISM="Thalassiosira antarctica, Strain CCMP982" /LENGTH=432 /DNA_ID=CAMNT_0048414371 /DNA_START=26 /DNA_END=1324 /DNA_ORIENTATION=-